jgi:putative phosphoesterase
VLVAAISDTHLPRGSRRLPAECVDRLRAADLILHGGDLTSAAFLEELRGLGPPVEAIHGNADDAEVRALLPAQLVVEAAGVRIGLVHNGGPRAGREGRLAARFPGCAAVVYGHTHLPQVEQHGGTWILNPGSPTERRRGPFRAMLLLEMGAGGTVEPELVRLP